MRWLQTRRWGGGWWRRDQPWWQEEDPGDRAEAGGVWGHPGSWHWPRRPETGGRHQETGDQETQEEAEQVTEEIEERDGATPAARAANWRHPPQDPFTVAIRKSTRQDLATGRLTHSIHTNTGKFKYKIQIHAKYQVILYILWHRNFSVTTTLDLHRACSSFNNIR